MGVLVRVNTNPTLSVQSRVVVADEDDEEAELRDQAGSTQLLFAEWDPNSDQEHKSALAKYGRAIFCGSLIIQD